MDAIRIETTLDSETLYLPQLKPFLGKNVEIVVQEVDALRVLPATQDLPAMQAAAEELENYDFDAWSEAREAEMQRANGRIL
jgi:hypothetical protein